MILPDWIILMYIKIILYTIENIITYINIEYILIKNIILTKMKGNILADV